MVIRWVDVLTRSSVVQNCAIHFGAVAVRHPSRLNPGLAALHQVPTSTCISCTAPMKRCSVPLLFVSTRHVKHGRVLLGWLLCSAYGRAGKIDNALEIFQDMIRRGCERNVITYRHTVLACLAGLFPCFTYLALLALSQTLARGYTNLNTQWSNCCFGPRCQTLWLKRDDNAPRLLTKRVL
eukprot:1156505-Pelagomonas_calceolata.AAC.15